MAALVSHASVLNTLDEIGFNPRPWLLRQLADPKTNDLGTSIGPESKTLRNTGKPVPPKPG
jgi:hypothetical protein